MKILVLGGHGFVGKTVMKVLQNSEHKAIALSRSDGLDLCDYSLTQKYFSNIQPEVIVNCAAKVGSLNYVTQQAAEVFDINMRMLLNIYKAAQEIVPQTVLLNPVANCAYPGDLESYVEDRFWDGKVHQSVLAYGNTRRMVLVLSETYSMQCGFKSINYHVPNMYGPYDSTDPNKAHALNALVSRIVKAKKEKLPSIEVWGSGIAIREWLFAKDFARIVAETIARLSADYGFFDPVNIAQNFGLSIRELVELIVQEAGYEGEIVWNRNMPDGAPKKVMDDKRFCKLFPTFKFTNIKDGISETIKYYESCYPY